MDLLAPEILNLFYQILQNLNLFFLDSPDLHIVLFFPHPGKKEKILDLSKIRQRETRKLLAKVSAVNSFLHIP